MGDQFRLGGKLGGHTTYRRLGGPLADDPLLAFWPDADLGFEAVMLLNGFEATGRLPELITWPDGAIMSAGRSPVTVALAVSGEVARELADLLNARKST